MPFGAVLLPLWLQQPPDIVTLVVLVSPLLVLLVGLVGAQLLLLLM
jgi:alpha-beta hydrolase superfamily lysophospholipase